MTFEIKPYRIELSSRARQPWTYFKLNKPHWKTPYWFRHLVWGKISLYVDTPDIDEIQVCPHCNGDVNNLGEDGISFCDSGCGCIEGEKDKYVTMREYEARA